MRAISVKLLQSIPVEARVELTNLLAPYGQVHNGAGENFFPGWDEVILILQTMGTVGSAVEMVNQLLEWRKKWLNRKGGQVKLTATNVEEIDAATATDEELRAWVRRARGANASSGE